MRRALALAAAAALVPATEAFAFGAAPAVRAPGCTGQQMCANGDGAPKASLSSKAVALFSALCIGGVAPSASRARDLSADAQATIVGDGTALVVTEEAPKESRSMKSVLVGGVAGAAGFGSVFLLRKGAKKDPSSQEFIEKKQEEWKAEAPTVSRAAQVPCMRHAARAPERAPLPAARSHACNETLTFSTKCARLGGRHRCQWRLTIQANRTRRTLKQWATRLSIQHRPWSGEA